MDSTEFQGSQLPNALTKENKENKKGDWSHSDNNSAKVKQNLNDSEPGKSEHYWPNKNIFRKKLNRAERTRSFLVFDTSFLYVRYFHPILKYEMALLLYIVSIWWKKELKLVAH